MLKRSPGSKIYCVPSSTIELLQGFLATWDSLAGRGKSCVTCDGHRWITSEASDASGVAGSQLGCSDPGPAGKDMWVRSSTEGNVLHRQNAGDQVPTTPRRTAWVTMRRAPLVWTPWTTLPLVHMTDGQSTCESVGLPTYQPVGASMMSVRVVPKTRNAPAGHKKVPIPGPRRFAMGSLPDFVGCLVISTSSWIKATAPSPPNKTR